MIKLQPFKGNLTREPELKFTANGTAICNFGVAHTNRFQKNGEWVNGDTIFVDVTVFGDTAKQCNEELKKGATVEIQGRLAQDRWDDRNTGTKRSKTYVVAFSVERIEKFHKTKTEPKDDDGDLPW